ncbi:MAG: hypothetical protein HYZ42_06070 [Bacteroidetes bacterium]|nr:hypothetical protein [Bacteroidota bacterium]
MGKSIDKLKLKLANKFGFDNNNPEFNIGVNMWKPFLEDLASKNKQPNNTVDYLTDNIDKILIDLAEVFPILAYELSGQHNIKERLNRAQTYFKEIEPFADEMPFNIKEWINPKLTKDLLNDLDQSINDTAKRIDKKTLADSLHKIAKMTFDDDDDMDKFIDEYYNKIVESVK